MDSATGGLRGRMGERLLLTSQWMVALLGLGPAVYAAVY